MITHGSDGRRDSFSAYPLICTTATLAVDFESEARRKLEQIVEEVLGTERSVPLVMRVAEGHPAQILVHAAGGRPARRRQSWARRVRGHSRGLDQPELRTASDDTCGRHSSRHEG